MSLNTISYSKTKILWRAKTPNPYTRRRLNWVQPTNKKTHILQSSVARKRLFLPKTTPYAKLKNFSYVILTFNLSGKVKTMPNRLRRYLIARAKKLKHRDVLSKKCWVTLGILFFIYTKGQNMRMGKGDGSLYSSYRYVLPAKPLFMIGSNSFRLQVFFGNYLSCRFGSRVRSFFKPSFNFYTEKVHYGEANMSRPIVMRFRYSRNRFTQKSRLARSLMRRKDRLYRFKWGVLRRKKVFFKSVRKKFFSGVLVKNQIAPTRIGLNSNTNHVRFSEKQIRKYASNNNYQKLLLFFD